MPENPAQRLLLRFLETFFSRPILHALPLILLTLFGVFTAVKVEKEYRSEGVLNATSGTLLAELTGQTPSFGYESVGSVTARNVQQLLTTNSFVADVVRRAGLTTAVESGVLDEDDVRASIVATPRGDNLVAVSATTSNPEQSQRLAAATLSGFVEHVVTNDIADASVRIETYEQIRDGYYDQLTQAIDELNEYVATHPAGDEENRPVDERLAITRLQNQVDRIADVYEESEQSVNDAQLAANVARTVVARQLRVVDEPGLPTLPENGLRSAVMVVGMFFVLGSILSLGFVIVRALLDRSVSNADEVENRFGVEILAIVPRARA
jgi:capsular polysaccharide biosynthesis protein